MLRKGENNEMSISANKASEIVTATNATAEMVKAQVEALVKSALDEAMTKGRTETAEPDNWWNLYAIGPIQATGVPAPLPPHQVIKVGEQAFIATVLFLNPFEVLVPGTTPADILSNFALPYEVQYQTGNLTSWTLGPGDLRDASSSTPHCTRPQRTTDS